jgi:hypothetical protein
MNKGQQYTLLAAAVVTLFVLLAILYLIYPAYLPISAALPIIILIVVGILSILIAVFVWLIVRKTGKPDTNTQILKIFLFVIVGLSATVILSIMLEYVPSTTSQTIYRNNEVGLYVIVTREPFIKIPLENVLIPRESEFKVDVYPKQKQNILSTSLRPIGETVISNPVLTRNNASDNDHYIASAILNAQHDGQLSNKTYPYAVDIFYTSQNNSDLQSFSIPFTWPIQKMDFSMLNYFWIVLIGVITSRLSKRYAEHHSMGKRSPGTTDTTVAIHTGALTIPKQTSSAQPPYLKPTDFLWIGFSAIIALLIFSSFEENVTLTSFIITNVSVAFGFGFGFDKVLEAGQEFLNK